MASQTLRVVGKGIIRQPLVHTLRPRAAAIADAAAPSLSPLQVSRGQGAGADCPAVPDHCNGGTGTGSQRPDCRLGFQNRNSPGTGAAHFPAGALSAPLSHFRSLGHQPVQAAASGASGSGLNAWLGGMVRHVSGGASDQERGDEGPESTGVEIDGMEGPQHPAVAATSAPGAEGLVDSESGSAEAPEAQAGAEGPEAEVGTVTGVSRRVAPLPEDVVPVEAGEGGGEDAESGPSRRARRAAKEEAQAQAQEIPYPRFAAAQKVPEERRKAPAAVSWGKKPQKEAAVAQVEVPLMEAIKRVKAAAKAKFDETVEVHVKLGVDPKRSDQTVRGSAVLPRGSGKSSRIAVFADGAKADEAKVAGADIVGGAELIQQIKDSGGKLDFDKCIAIPPLMPQLTQVARILGPRGLMPNPKMGTVTMNVAEAVATAKRGKADFRADRTGNIHCGVGKVSFSDEALRDNIAAVAAALLAAKPAGLKKTSKFSGYFTSVTIASTMGAGVRTSVPSISSAVDTYAKADGSG